MARARVSVLCALLVCAPLPALAQSIESVGIRAQGVAGAFVAVADDATATWWNPAGLPHSQSFIDGIVEVGRGGHWGVAFGFPALGLSYYHLNISQIQPSASTAAGGTSRQDHGAVGTDLPVPYSVGFNQFGATVGQSLGDHFVVATTVKVMNALSDTRGDFDLGAMAAFGPVRAGLNVRNLIGGTFGTPAATRNVFELTRQARAGVAVTPRTARVARPADALAGRGPDDGAVRGPRRAPRGWRRRGLAAGTPRRRARRRGREHGQRCRQTRPTGPSASRCRRFSDVSWMEWPVGDRPRIGTVGVST